MAPLFALGAIAAGLILFCDVLSVRGTAAADVADDSLRRTAVVGFALATLTLAAEQAARAGLGITTGTRSCSAAVRAGWPCGSRLAR